MAIRKEKRKNDFRYVLDYYDQFGKRHYQALPKGATRKEADAAEREILASVAKGVYLPERKIPTFGKVCQDWLEYKKTKVRDSTLWGYNNYVKNHFGEFGDLKVNALTTAKIESFISGKEQAGMPIKTLRQLIGLLNQTLNFAVRHKYIESNFLSAIERPRGHSEDKWKILEPSEINRLLSAVSDPLYHCLFKLAIFSGARQGELLGLKWSDVDFKAGHIHIQRSFNTKKVYPTKNKTSNRKIDLGSDMLQTLRNFRETRMHNELVFADTKGEHLKAQTVLIRFKKALKAAGLSAMRFHDLRHTYATLLHHQGEKTKVIQVQMGHSTPIQTLNTYSHLMKDRNSDVADRLEKAVFSACS